MNINVAELLNGNYILLLFVVLALGLCLGKLRLGSIQLGNSIGVLVVSLLLGQQHFSINTDALNLGFMLFIFCVGVEAGPNFFSVFFRDGKNYLMLALVMVGSALVIALGLGKLFGWDIGLTAGMLAGSMTSTPVLVGAGDTLRHSGMESRQLSLALDNLSLGYALTYLIGLVSLIVGARYLPKLQHQDLQTSAQQIARERGLDTDANRKVYLPVIRAYRVGPELVAWTDGKNLRELGIYRQTGCYIERIRRNGILANPDGDAVLQMGDEIALVGYPDAHARLDPSFRNGKEVFDRDLLDTGIPGFDGQRHTYLAPLLGDQLQHFLILRLRQRLIDRQRQPLAVFTANTVGVGLPAGVVQQLSGFGLVEGQFIAQIDIAGGGAGQYGGRLRVVSGE